MPESRGRQSDFDSCYLVRLDRETPSPLENQPPVGKASGLPRTIALAIRGVMYVVSPPHRPEYHITIASQSHHNRIARGVRTPHPREAGTTPVQQCVATMVESITRRFANHRVCGMKERCMAARERGCTVWAVRVHPCQRGFGPVSRPAR